MALLSVLLLVAGADRRELEGFGLLQGDGIPVLLEDNPKLCHDPEVQPSDVAVKLVEVDATSGEVAAGSDATLASLLRGDLDGVVVLLGTEASVKNGIRAFVQSQVEVLARKRPAVIVIDMLGGGADLVELCAAISDDRARLTVSAAPPRPGQPLSVSALQQLQDRFREQVKSLARQRRSPSVAIGSLVVARDTGRLFLGRKLRGVGRGELATVGGNLTKEGPIDEALRALLTRRLGARPYAVGPLLACSVLTRGGVRFVDMTFLVVVDDEDVQPDAEEFSESRWYSLDEITESVRAADLFEPVANALAKYRHLSLLESVVDALAPIALSVRAMRPDSGGPARYDSPYPPSFRSPYFFESSDEPPLPPPLTPG